MIKINLIFVDKKETQLDRNSVTGQHYYKDGENIKMIDNWLYETSSGPLFTIGCTLSELGIAKTHAEQEFLSRQYKCFKIHRVPSKKNTEKETRYATEITDR